MAKHNSNPDNNNSRRKFIQQSGVLGAGVMLAGTSQLFAEGNKPNNMSSY